MVEVIRGRTLSAAGRLARSGFTKATTGEVRTALQVMRDRLDALEADRDMTVTEKRTEAKRAVAAARQVLDRAAQNVTAARDRLHNASRRVDEQLRHRLARLTPFELLRIQRRAETIGGESIADAVDRGDHEAVLAHALVSDRGLWPAAVVFAQPADLAELTSAKAWWRDLQEVERARMGIAELEASSNPHESARSAGDLLMSANGGEDETMPLPTLFGGPVPADVPNWIRGPAGLPVSAPPQQREHIIEPKADEQPAPNAPPQSEGGGA